MVTILLQTNGSFESKFHHGAESILTVVGREFLLCDEGVGNGEHTCSSLAEHLSIVEESETLHLNTLSLGTVTKCLPTSKLRVSIESI